MAGWEAALTRLVAERGADLKRYAFLLCGNAQDAEDLVQDALVRTFTRTRRGEIERIEHYVRRVILNLVLDRARRAQVWRRLVPLAATPVADPGAPPGIAERTDMARALASLPARERAAVVLRYYLDLPVSEVAEQLGCQPGTVKRYLHDARVRLAGQLGNDPTEDAHVLH